MKNWIPTSISIVAIGIAVFAMAKVAPVEGLDFDYYGAIIGVKERGDGYLFHE